MLGIPKVWLVGWKPSLDVARESGFESTDPRATFKPIETGTVVKLKVIQSYAKNQESSRITPSIQYPFMVSFSPQNTCSKIHGPITRHKTESLGYY